MGMAALGWGCGVWLRGFVSEFWTSGIVYILKLTLSMGIVVYGYNKSVACVLLKN